MSRRKGINAVAWFSGQSFNGGSRERSMNGSCLPVASGQAKKASETRLETVRNSASLERPMVVDPGSSPGVSTNPYERAARQAKAERLAISLHAAGVMAAEVSRIEACFWVPLAKAAGVNPPSAETIIEVEKLMQQMEAAKAVMA